MSGAPLTWWRHGGPTDIANLALLCGRHHTLVHLGIWGLTVRDGRAWAQPPAWIDPERRLIRNTLRDAADAARYLGVRLRLNVERAGTGPPRAPAPPEHASGDG